MVVAAGLVGAVTLSILSGPQLLFVLTVGGVLVGGVVWLVLRSATKTTEHRFVDALGRRDAIAVLMHPDPDPDAMSSALAVRELARGVGTDATIYYTGQINRQENKAFETALDVNFNRIETTTEIDADDVVLVDHNVPRGFADEGNLTPFAVIDHHMGSGSGTEHTDVRTDVGACATILADYFRSVGVTPGADSGGIRRHSISLPSSVATALVYGIQSDTNGLTTGSSKKDFEACAYLFPGVDVDVLGRIANPEVEAEVLDVTARAISNREVRDTFACSHVGSVSNVDAIPQAADQLIRLEGVTAAVVTGDCDGTIYLSGRSRDDRVHMGKVLQTTVADVPESQAGGHARMGGGQITIPTGGDADRARRVTPPELSETIFEALAGDR
jgi:nanoRNase/pAp phosphatase (c-di-AMP/oligoRNAs hydrolase)